MSEFVRVAVVIVSVLFCADPGMATDLKLEEELALAPVTPPLDLSRIVETFDCCRVRRSNGCTAVGALPQEDGAARPLR